MKAVKVMIFLLLSGVWFGPQGNGKPEAARTVAISPEEAEKILQATVRIQVEGKIDSDTLLVEHGLGSLVRLGDDLVVVTHNHWGPALDEFSTVVLHSADNRRLAMLSGWALLQSIRYQDQGTLAFNAPDYMVEHPLDSPEDLPEMQLAIRAEPGMAVQAVHHLRVAGKPLGVQAMVVEAVEDQKQPPVYRLRSLSGQPIQPGDSGGGVWVNGALAANLWSTIMIASGVELNTSAVEIADQDFEYSDQSFAAVLDWRPARAR